MKNIDPQLKSELFQTVIVALVVYEIAKILFSLAVALIIQLLNN